MKYSSITKAELEKLNSKDPREKYGCAKELLQIASDEPGLLYDYFDYWINLMISGNNVLKWTAIDIIGYLSSVDNENKIDNKIIDDLIAIMHSGVLISANHAIFSLGLIAKNKPEYKKTIFKEFFLLNNDEFKTEDCKNIAIGKVMEAIKPFSDDLKNDPSAILFIENASQNPRNSTKKKAVQLLNKLSKK